MPPGEHAAAGVQVEAEEGHHEGEVALGIEEDVAAQEGAFLEAEEEVQECVEAQEAEASAAVVDETNP